MSDHPTIPPPGGTSPALAKVLADVARTSALIGITPSHPSHPAHMLRTRPWMRAYLEAVAEGDTDAAACCRASIDPELPRHMRENWVTFDYLWRLANDVGKDKQLAPDLAAFGSLLIKTGYQLRRLDRTGGMNDWVTEDLRARLRETVRIIAERIA